LVRILLTTTRRHLRLAVGVVAGVGFLLLGAVANHAADRDETEIALDLAELLRSARAVIASHQDLINDPERGDKGLTGAVIADEAAALFEKARGFDPRSADPASREGRLLQAQLQSIAEVVDANQATINEQGVGFKGFVPAVFARLVNERFVETVGDEVALKVTAPAHLVRNRKARPDAWESAVIQDRFMAADWPSGQPFFEIAEADGRQAFRFLLPEYYSSGCLSCHGEPQGEIDITGYPKEGGRLGDLGGAISISLFH
jgi:hypothetical protein